MTHDVGIGVFASLPHFLFGDDILTTKVTGLNPDPNLHRIVIDVEPISGKSLQCFTRTYSLS